MLVFCHARDQLAKLDYSAEQEDRAKRALLEAERQRLQRLPSNSRYAAHRLRVVSRALDLLNIAATVRPNSQLPWLNALLPALCEIHLSLSGSEELRQLAGHASRPSICFFRQRGLGQRKTFLGALSALLWFQERGQAQASELDALFASLCL